MSACRFVLILCSALQCQAFDSTFVGFDGKQHQNPAKWERDRLRRFIGLRKNPHRHAVVITNAPVIHKGLHMLNHRVDRVGPLKVQMLKPFGRSNHSLRTLNNTASPIATYVSRVAGHPKGWDAIKVSRADMCVKMLGKHGVDFTDNKDKCMAFMDKTCRVPDEVNTPANHIKRPSGEGVCKEWYDLLDSLRKEAKSGKRMASTEGVGAPSPAVAMAPGTASAPEPPGGVSDRSRPSGWSRMDESEGHPEQGFSGELVAHDNMKTVTSDWHAEYGPHAKGHQSYEAICAQYPDNTWCKLRGYRAAKMKAEKSAATRLQTLVLTLAAPVLASLCW